MNSEYISYLKEAGYHPTTARKMFGKASTLCDGAVSDGGYQEGSAEDIFGIATYRATIDVPESVEPTFSNEPLFQLLVIALVVVYMHMVLRAWHFIGSIWSGVIDYRRSEQNMTYAGGALPLSRFKLTAAIIGAVSIALVVVRLMDIYLVGEAAIYDMGISNVMPLVMLIIISAVLLGSYLLHVVLGWVTCSKNAKELATIGYINIVRAVVALFLPTAVWLVANGTAEGIVGWVLIVGLTLFVAIYLKDTFIFFLEKKVSVFNWFLYLCTAILLPLSFLAAWLPRMLQ